MDELPLSSAGKVKREALREYVLSMAATGGGDSPHV